MSDNKSSKPFIERIFEVNVKKINLSIVSDYQEELDLFFVQLAVCIQLLLSRRTLLMHSFHVGCRCDAGYAHHEHCL